MPVQRMMLIGETGSGKSALIQALSGERFTSRRAMAVEYCGSFINTPGEFLENRRFYFALITTSMDCDIVAMIQDATRSTCLFPPKFATIFNKKIVGIITKSQEKNARIERAERFLKSAGAKNILQVDLEKNMGFDALRAILL